MYYVRADPSVRRYGAFLLAMIYRIDGGWCHAQLIQKIHGFISVDVALRLFYCALDGAIFNWPENYSLCGERRSCKHCC
jgi:hypothetical protein